MTYLRISNKHNIDLKYLRISNKFNINLTIIHSNDTIVGLKSKIWILRSSTFYRRANRKFKVVNIIVYR